MPTTNSFEIEEVRHVALMYGRSGWRATILTPDYRLGVSRYDGDTDWVVDSQWMRRNNFPVFHYGEGSRCSVLTLVRDAGMVAALAAVIVGGGS